MIMADENKTSILFVFIVGIACGLAVPLTDFLETKFDFLKEIHYIAIMLLSIVMSLLCYAFRYLFRIAGSRPENR